MWDDAYKKEQEKIKTPAFLKAETLQKMEEAKRKEWRFFGPKLTLGLSFSILAMILAVNFFNLPTNESQMLTDLTFERIEGSGLRFGVTQNNEEISLAEVEARLGVTISEWDFLVLHLEDVSWQIDNETVRVLYLFENNDQSVELMLNNQTDTIATNSVLNDMPLALYYRILLTEKTFIAEFIVEDLYYQLRATGLTETEMVTLLEEIFDFLN